MRLMKPNRALRQLIVHGVGPGQADCPCRGCRHDHDRRGGPDDGLALTDPPVPAISLILQVLKMPKVP